MVNTPTPPLPLHQASMLPELDSTMLLWWAHVNGSSIRGPGSSPQAFVTLTYGEWQQAMNRKGMYFVSFCATSMQLTRSRYRERIQGLERRSRSLSSPARRRTSGMVIPGPQLLPPTPPATQSSQPQQASQSSCTGPVPNARSIAQRARRERERQQRLSSTSNGIPPTPPPIQPPWPQTQCTLNSAAGPTRARTTTTVVIYESAQ